MDNLKYSYDFLFGTSTFFDEDNGWTKKTFNGFFHTRTFEVFGGWKCRQVCENGKWYDLD